MAEGESVGVKVPEAVPLPAAPVAVAGGLLVTVTVTRPLALPPPWLALTESEGAGEGVPGAEAVEVALWGALSVRERVGVGVGVLPALGVEAALLLPAALSLGSGVGVALPPEALPLPAAVALGVALPWALCVAVALPPAASLGVGGSERVPV